MTYKELAYIRFFAHPFAPTHKLKSEVPELGLKAGAAGAFVSTRFAAFSIASVADFVNPPLTGPVDVFDPKEKAFAFPACLPTSHRQVPQEEV